MTLGISPQSGLDIVGQNSGGGSSPLTAKGDVYTYSTTNARLAVGADGQVLTADSAQATGLKWSTVSGTGTVTSVAGTNANGVSFSITNPTTTPNITVALGAITPASVASSGSVSGTDWTGTNVIIGSVAAQFTGASYSLELGSLSSVNTPLIDFHSSGYNIDFDSRLMGGGGNGVIGNGNITFFGSKFRFNGVTSSFPSLKNSGATLQARLADDSAHANFECAGLTASGSISGSNLSGTNTGNQNVFSTIAVSGQSDVVADSTADTLTFAAGNNITITTNATTDTVTIAAGVPLASFVSIS